MPIEDRSNDSESPGEFLYNTLQARILRLPATAQLAIAMALRGGGAFRDLAGPQQEVFDQTAEDLEL